MADQNLDRQAFRQLFEENYNLLCNYINSRIHDWELSQEISQRAFVKLWEKREEIKIDSSAKNYLFGTARNALIDHVRARKVAHSHIEKYSSDIVFEEPPEDLNDVTMNLRHKIYWAVNQLKPKTRKIFLLSKQEGLTYEEIADYLQISKRTVEYNMKNALLELKELLKDKIFRE